MLRHLHVRNLAVFEEASVDFDDGLNVVTGETGSGKSLVVDSLGLLAGTRASGELIRSGADTMSVTGVFEPEEVAVLENWRVVLEDAGIECSGPELVIRRELSRSGRNRVFVNDQPVTLKLLSRVAASLLRIHGQRDELDLLSTELQRDWLDRQGGTKGESLLASCARAHLAYREAAERLARVAGDDQARQERIDLLRYQASEIEQGEVVAGEETGLKRDRERLRHAEEIASSLVSSVHHLSEDELAVTIRLSRTENELVKVAEWEPEAKAWVDEVRELRIRAEELVATLHGRLGGVEAQPGRLDAVEARLAVLERLLRKYGTSSEEVLARLERIRGELDELEVDETRLAELEAEVSQKMGEYRDLAQRLSKARRQWAKALEAAVESELAQLALKDARLKVHLDLRKFPGSPLLIGGEEVDFHSWGYDVVSFLFSSNPGEELRPLAKVASGGELARVYLALQTAARVKGNADSATLVFDEVDAGVGGAEAATVGGKLRRLSAGGQILAVTHLPQVASCGHHHHRVFKRVAKGRTRVGVGTLDSSERVEEVARMLGGEEITELARKHARELLVEAEAPDSARAL